MEEARHQVRAHYSANTITVYQAYRPEIGVAAAHDGRFPDTWDRDRMTWVKPSFLWMMYRCGWATKEGQETVLAFEITREGFEWALRHACLSHYESGLHADRSSWQRTLKRAPARVQWDPERDLHLQPIACRSLQLGLAREAARLFADEWTVSISDVTPLAHEIHALVTEGDLDGAARRPRTRPDRVLADKAYGSRANRAYLRRRRIRCTIPEKADQVANRKKKGSPGGRRPAFDPERCKQRHAVGCGINRLKRNRAVATR